MIITKTILNKDNKGAHYMNINLLDWFGYLASLVVLISLLSSSILRLRWINLVGASLFAAYGFMIGSLPTAMMNLGIVVIDIYYLFRYYSAKEFFQVLEITPDSNYFNSFMDFHKDDVKKFFNKENMKITDATIGFYVLRNMVPAGVFIGEPLSSTRLRIDLDFAVAEYRDFKIGDYIYNKHPQYFLDFGFNELVATTSNDAHTKYLEKMGFVKQGQEYIKKLG